MTKDEKKQDILDVLKEFREKVLVFDKELERLKLPYIKLANKNLADVVKQTTDDLEEYKRLVKEKVLIDGRQN